MYEADSCSAHALINRMDLLNKCPFPIYLSLSSMKSTVSNAPMLLMVTSTPKLLTIQWLTLVRAFINSIFLGEEEGGSGGRVHMKSEDWY